MDPAFKDKTAQRHVGSVMVWDDFYGTVWDLWCMYYLDGIRYMKLLVYDLYKFMLFCYPHSNGFFQQHNSTSQKSLLAPAGWRSVSQAFLLQVGHKVAQI